MNIFKKAYNWIKNKILKIVNKITMKHIKVYNTDNEITGIDYYPNLTVVRNGEKTAGSGDYIRNGLVLMLDGLNKGTDTDGWTDLISQRIFTSNNAYRNENNYTTSTGHFLSNSDSLTIPDSCTIEVCYDAGTSSSGTIFSPNGSSKIAFSISNNLISWSTAQQPRYSSQTTPLSGGHTISVNSSLGIMDINQRLMINTDSVGSVTASSNNTIGACGTNGGSNPFSGKIYAIRIYNRQLTVTEMKHNQQEDVKRYGVLIGASSIKDYMYLCAYTALTGEAASAYGYDYRIDDLVYDYEYEEKNPTKVLLHWTGNVTIPAGSSCWIDTDVISFNWVCPFNFVPGNAYMFELSGGVMTYPDVLKITPFYFRQNGA